VLFKWDDKYLYDQPFDVIWRPAPLDHFKIIWEKTWQSNILLGTATSDENFKFTVVPIDTLGNTAECEVETIRKSLMVQYPSGSRRNDFQITK
jgi:hypothetical protein